MNENELYHFGVKGMKWGVRRNRSSFVSTSGPKRLPGTYASDGNGWTAKAKRLSGAIVKKDGYDKSRTPKGVASLTSKTSGKSKQKGVNYPEPIKRALGRATASKAGRAAIKVSGLNKSQKKQALKENEILAKRYDNEKSKKKAAANTPEAQAARKEKMKKAAKVGAAVAGTALAAYGVYKVSKAISNKKQMQAAEAAAKKSMADMDELMKRVADAKSSPYWGDTKRAAYSVGEHSYVYDKALGMEGYMRTENLNFLRQRNKK